MKYTLRSPLVVYLNKTRKWKLNLNHYRNSYFHILNKAKTAYYKVMEEEVKKKIPDKIREPVKITYTFFPETKRRYDLANVCSVHDKFFCDLLIDMGILRDDNYLCIPSISYQIGNYVRGNGRVEITIEPYDI